MYWILLVINLLSLSLPLFDAAITLIHITLDLPDVAILNPTVAAASDHGSCKSAFALGVS